MANDAYFYPTPNISALDDISPYIGLLLGAVDVELDRPDAWTPGDEDLALSFIQDLKVYITELVTMIPVGGIIDYPGEIIPTCWLLCDGALVTVAEYPKLFAVIGRRYGVGDGVTNFELPNLLGRGTLGATTEDSFTDVLGNDVFYPLSILGGSVDVTLNVSQMPLHSHIANQAAHSHTVTHSHAIPTTATGAAGTADRLMRSTGGIGVNLNTLGAAPTTTSVLPAINVSSTGLGEPHENMPPFMAMNKIIRVK